MLIEHIPTDDLMCELVSRTIANRDDVPRSVLQLTYVMASVMSTQYRFAFAEAMRDAADDLEQPERVHVRP